MGKFVRSETLLNILFAVMLVLTGYVLGDHDRREANRTAEYMREANRSVGLINANTQETRRMVRELYDREVKR